MVLFNPLVRSLTIAACLFVWQCAKAEDHQISCLSGDFFNCGFEKQDASDHHGAIMDYTEAIRLDPQDYTSYFNRAISKDALNDRSGAIDDLNRAIELNPKYAKAYQFRGYLRMTPADFEGTIAD